jgi:hypothetical protein
LIIQKGDEVINTIRESTKEIESFLELIKEKYGDDIGANCTTEDIELMREKKSELVNEELQEMIKNRIYY